MGGQTLPPYAPADHVFYRDIWNTSDGVNWQEVPNTPWAPRHAASVFVYDDALWMVAGNHMEHDVWKLQRASTVCADRRNPDPRAPVSPTSRGPATQ